MSTYFKRVLEELNEQNSEEDVILNENEIKVLLRCLNYKEQAYIRRIFKTINWNIGSLNILQILQDCNIWSASEYLLMQENSEEYFQHIQSVLSDMLETKSDLFSNVISNCVYNSSNSKLSLYLEEAIQRLVKDFQQNENIISNVYFTNVLPFLEVEAQKYFANLHINILLELNASNAKIALGQIDVWRFSITKNSNFYNLLNEIIKIDLINTTNKILQTSLFPNFQHWKYLVIILNFIVNNIDDFSCGVIKKHLRETFKTAITNGSLNLLLSTLIIARTVCPDEKCNGFETYSEWYKNTFGDLKYIANNKQKFITAIELLTTIIEAETNSKYLEIHARISISPLTHCNDIVLKYKQKCRDKLEILSRHPSPKKLKLDDSINANLSYIEKDLFASEDSSSSGNN